MLLSAPHIHAEENAGYMMEELVLKLTELDIDSCWLTFTDSARIKAALGLTTPLEVAAIVAFGYGEKTQKKLRLNILNMSTVDVTVERQYFAPKKGIRELVNVDTWANKEGLDEMLGFYDEMLRSLVGSEMCIRDRRFTPYPSHRAISTVSPTAFW